MKITQTQPYVNAKRKKQVSATQRCQNENSLGQVPKPCLPKRIYGQSLLQLTETPLKLVNLSSVKPPHFVSQNINSCAMHL